MLRDYWYIAALGITASIISVLTNQWMILGLYLIWIFILLIYRRINILFCFIACAATILSYMYFPEIEDKATAQNEVEELTHIEGKIISPPLMTENRIEFEFLSVSGEKLLVTHFNNEDETITVNKALHHGATCYIDGSSMILNQATNPHQFDYKRYLNGKGITSQFSPDNLDSIKCSGRSAVSYIYSIRNMLINKTEKKLTPKTVEWLHALVLGDDSQLNKDLIAVFQRWGLSHILAISGLHIGIVVGLIYFICVRCSLLTKEKTALFLILFLPVYAMIAGGQPSVWRASIMVLVTLLIAMFRFRLNYSDILSITFMLLVFLDKYIIYHVGFQLSFAVTFAIILSKDWLASSKSAFGMLFKLSFISQMAILPLQIHYFSIFEPSSIIVNIIAVPYFSLFVIPAMFAFLFLSWLPASLLYSIESIFHFLHDIAIHLIFMIDRFFHFPFIIGKYPFGLSIIYYVLLILFMASMEKQQPRTSFKYGLMICLFIVFLALRPYLSPYGTVTMLDIGQGDAFIIELPHREGVYFVDIGAQVKFPDFEATDKEYRQIIRPYLYGQGINSIDAVYLSHEDLDHDGSLAFLLEDFPVKEVIISEYYEIDQGRITAWSKKRHPDIRRVQKEERVIHKNLVMNILGPLKKTDSENENSLVLFTKLGGLSWIFTGDIGKDTEKQLINHYPNLTFDVLKVAHHGSKHSTDESFAKRTNYIALISAGRNNTYGHPTDEVLEHLNDQQLKIYRTDQDGAVQYKFKGEKGAFIPFIP